MDQKMLIEADPHQTRVAVLEDGRLVELFVERHHHRGVVGNIYKGRVNRVLPGMQAAFVDIGLERDAFLYVTEVLDPLSRAGGFGDEDSEQEANIEAPPPIDQLLETGMELTVQVLKDAMPNKGARISTQVTLPGRYLVLLPNVRHLGVSRRIEDEDERERLRSLVEDLMPPEDGLIVRTAGAGCGLQELQADLAYLQTLWRKIRRRSDSVSAPTLLHRDLDLALRSVRDFLTRGFTEVLIDGGEIYYEVIDFLEQVQPGLVDRVRRDEHEEPLLERYGVDEETESALRPKVWLRSGGHIVIDPTEALVAIDINTGRFVGRNNLEETVRTTNLEAVREIVRQIRLRNLGGIIVIDLIDMMDPAHAEEVFEVLNQELAKDRAKSKVLNISEFGLVEITRKRTRPSLERLLTQPCPYCSGTGRIKSLSSICLDLRSKVLRKRHSRRGGELIIRLHPQVAQSLQTEERPILSELEKALRMEIMLQSDVNLHHHRFEIFEH